MWLRELIQKAMCLSVPNSSQVGWGWIIIRWVNVWGICGGLVCCGLRGRKILYSIWALFGLGKDKLNLNSKGKNLVLVTHYVVISSILHRGVSSGEIVVSDKKLNIIGSIATN